MSLRDLDIDIDLDISGSSQLHQVDQQVNQLVAHIQSIGNIDINADISMNEALANIQNLENQLNQISDETVDIDVNTEFMTALQELALLDAQIQSLDNDNVFIDVDLHNSTASILQLRAQLQVLEAQASHINVDIDTAGAHAQLALLQAHINGINGPPTNSGSTGLLGMAGNMMSGMASLDLLGTAVKGAGVLALLPAIATLAQVAIGAVGALGVAIGVVAGAALGLVSAVGVAGIGLLGFGALAIGTLTEIYEKDAELTASQAKLKKQTDSVLDTFEDLKKSVEKDTFEAITSGVKALNTALDMAEPILKASSDAVDGLFKSLNKSFKGDDMKGFFSYLERAIEPLTANIGNGLGYALMGVLNTMTALEPLTSWIGQGFENMMGSFSEWTSGLVDSKAMESFMSYTMDNLPKLGDAIGDMTLGIVDFFAAFSDSASGGFDWFADLMADFKDWSAGLSENEGFQKMLDNIAEDGPHIASTIGNITTNLIDLISAISSVGKDENGEGGLWAFLDKLSNPKNFNTEGIADMFSFESLLNPFGAVLGAFNFDPMINSIKTKFSSIKINVSEWFSDAKLNVSEWFSGAKTDASNLFTKTKINVTDWISKTKINITDWFSKTKLNIADFFTKTKVSITDWISNAKLNISQFFTNTKINVAEWLTGKLNLGTSIKGFSWSDYIKKLEWPSVKGFSWGKYIKDFIWPKIEKISLVKFVKDLVWPKIEKISLASFVHDMKWPSIDKINLGSFIPPFKWPDMSGIKNEIMSKIPAMPKISMPKISVPSFKMPSFGFSSGLGRVPNDMNATIHKDEAVIQADKAQQLRDEGILSGDGRHPTINTSGSNNTTSSSSGGNSFSMPITINVQGGNTNSETTGAIISAIESAFSNFRDVFPAMREG